MNSMNDSGEFQEVESNNSGRLSHVCSQPAMIPSSRSLLSRDKRLPLDTWNTLGQQEHVFGNQFSFLDVPKSWHLTLPTKENWQRLVLSGQTQTVIVQLIHPWCDDQDFGRATAATRETSSAVETRLLNLSFTVVFSCGSSHCSSTHLQRTITGHRTSVLHQRNGNHEAHSKVRYTPIQTKREGSYSWSRLY